MRGSRSALAVMLLMTSSAASAAETITYSYDARGRLTQVKHAGSVNDGLQTSYTLDKADNRMSVAVSGGGTAIGVTAPTSPCLAVVPLGGAFRSIPCSRSP